MYAIVDIETTGGSADKSRITEVAIYRFDGEKVVDEFVTLINPESFIPSNITRLTGISNEMVANAPRFFEVARRIVEITDGAFFVAHNVTFDYRFIQAEFKRLGYSFSRNTLCTVKLSRKHLPGHSSYSLGSICSDLRIPINGRHRAAGDALATVKLFEILLSAAPGITNEGFGSGTSYSSSIDTEKVLNLPEATGVYYLSDSQGEIIYIGKSTNIKKRVLEHLTRPTTKRAVEMASHVADIGYELTGSELLALIVEADEIKGSLPKYNKRGRRRSTQLGIVSHIDSKGYINLKIEKVDDADIHPTISFENANEAQTLLHRMVEEHNLCQKLCGLYNTNNACFHYQIGQCKGACIGEEPADIYNLRVTEALDTMSLGSRSFILVDDGRNADEKSFVKVQNGKIEGYGFFNPEYIGRSTDLLKETVKPCGNHREALMAVRSFMGKASVKIVEI
ncbi:MAG: exonuclease [Bacteroidetes bacterium HGW-Bacteroidetes-15]|nr:MAG: exonuclease [Bacteroidetes bacterium HGW-Bacteroidetes-15]